MTLGLCIKSKLQDYNEQAVNWITTKKLLSFSPFFLGKVILALAISQSSPSKHLLALMLQQMASLLC